VEKNLQAPNAGFAAAMRIEGAGIENEISAIPLFLRANSAPEVLAPRPTAVMGPTPVITGAPVAHCVATFSPRFQISLMQCNVLVRDITNEKITDIWFRDLAPAGEREKFKSCKSRPTLRLKSA